MPAGVVERFSGGRDREQNELVDLALVLGVHPLIRIEGAVGPVAARYLARDLAGQVGGFELLDAGGPAPAGEKARPGFLDAASERRDHTQARDDDATHHLDIG